MADAAVEPADAALWRALAADPLGPARLQLFEAHLPFSRRIAAQVRRDRAGADLDLDDLRQAAAEALLQAIDRYDPAQGAPFEAFAARRIAGAVIDGVAASSETRRQVAFRNRIRTERTRSLRAADAARLEPLDALQALADLATELAIGFILDEAAAPRTSVGALPDPYESVAWSETVQHAAAALESLPEQERTVIRLHYLKGLEFARIADTLSLSRGRVSQIHAAALQRLRKRLPRPDLLHFQR